MATKRARKTGQYTYSGDFSRVCQCGRVLGVHSAEAPHAFEDYSLDEREELPECEGFRPLKKDAK